MSQKQSRQPGTLPRPFSAGLGRIPSGKGAARVALWRKEQAGYVRRPTATARGYDRDWRELRAILDAEPNCQHCARRGIERKATGVNHIISIRDAPERRLDPSNLQRCCQVCHDAKTNRYDGGMGRERRRSLRGGPGRFPSRAWKPALGGNFSCVKLCLEALPWSWE
jgi:5-methylcytosine-specific restriction endonuclease McrA